MMTFNKFRENGNKKLLSGITDKFPEKQKKRVQIFYHMWRNKTMKSVRRKLLEHTDFAKQISRNQQLSAEFIPFQSSLNIKLQTPFVQNFPPQKAKKM